MSYQVSELQVSKPRIHPNGAHGDILKVSVNGVTGIEIADGIAIISYVRGGEPGRFAVRDYLHAVLTTEPNPFTCPKCGQEFKNTQGLGKHLSTHEKDAA